MKFVAFDNGGETLDRYTVIDEDGDMIGLSDTGAGVDLYVGNHHDWGMTLEDYRKDECIGVEIPFDSLPAEVRQRVLNRYDESEQQQ